MKGKYKPKPKKKVKPTPPPPLILVEQFTTSMFEHATCGSFEFKNISEEEFIRMTNNRKIHSYIHNQEFSYKLGELLGRRIKEISKYVSFYNTEDFILIQKSCWFPFHRNKPIFNYFYCQVFSNANRFWYEDSTLHPPRNSIS